MPDRNLNSTCEICNEHSGNVTGCTTSTSVPPHITISFQQCCIFLLIYTPHLLESKADNDGKVKKNALSDVGEHWKYFHALCLERSPFL